MCASEQLSVNMEDKRHVQQNPVNLTHMDQTGADCWMFWIISQYLY